MGRSSGRSSIPQPFVRKRSIGPGKIVVGLLFLLILILFVFYGLGGWHFSNEIYSSAFEVGPPTEPELDITLDRGEADAIVLQGSPDAGYLTDDGRFGLVSESTSGLVDRILSAETSNGINTVRRARVVGEPIPAPGSPVRLDPFVWQGDPETALGIPFEEIEFDVEGGKAPAWYVKGTTDTWMIFVHGKGASRSEALRMLP
ncbi:MAG TPA: hypothetical protein VFD97_00300, partial [Acidimicrobiia bacterium]|nr:hypothetical protein [Acidimicrobiia bacterium]